MDLLVIDSGNAEYYNSKKDEFRLKEIFFAKKGVLWLGFVLHKECKEFFSSKMKDGIEK